MFTGLIKRWQKLLVFKTIFFDTKSKISSKIGDSIAINGACLTVVKITNDTFTVELSPESQKSLQWKTTKMRFIWNQP